MALTRRMLKELGLEEESIEKILAEHGKVMEGMVTKAQAEDDKKSALEAFEKEYSEKHKPVEVKETEAYKELEKKYADLEFDVNIRNAKVKDKYKDFVKGKLPNDKPFDEGIKGIREEYPEFFDSDEPKTEPPKTKPSIGGETNKGEAEPTEADKIKAQFASAFKR